jgi:hypothetical protein
VRVATRSAARATRATPRAAKDTTRARIGFDRARAFAVMGDSVVIVRPERARFRGSSEG